MTENNRLMDNLKAITITMIFEASALNRDEKLGGNIPSIKKLTRVNRGTFGYISREAMRHYLFETLSKFYGDPWTPAECFESGNGGKKVVQFDLRRQNILTHAELDAFGYMFTIGGQSSITRKAAVGITKAVALEAWEGDMQFNANHDLAQRCGANPNPVNKEEQLSYFKVTFTIDVDKLGYDEWWIMDHSYNENTNELALSLSKERTDDVLKNVTEEGNSRYKIGEHEIRIDGLLCRVSKELMDEKTDKTGSQDKKKYLSFKDDLIEKPKNENEQKEQAGKKKKGKGKFKIYEGEYETFIEDDGEDNKKEFYQFFVGNHSYNQKEKTLTLSSGLTHTIEEAEKRSDQNKEYAVKKNGKIIGYIAIGPVGSKKKAIFKLAEEEKRERLRQILEVLKNGLIYHSSGENYGIVPQFIVAAGLKLPVPLFHSFIELGSFEKSVFNNSYILSDGSENKKLIYFYDPKQLVGSITHEKNIYDDWTSFLDALFPESKENKHNEEVKNEECSENQNSST